MIILKSRLCVLIFLLLAFLKPEDIRPKQIHVDGLVFPIHYSTKSPKDFSKEVTVGEDSLAGLTVCADDIEKDNYIQVDPNDNLADLQDTVWHEAHHAANHCAEMAVSERYDDIYPIQIPQELKLMQQNPTLVKFITLKEVK